MAIKDQNIEMAKDENGNEYIAEMEGTIEVTEADGTEVVAEVKATADPDDTTDIEGTISVTETAPDGTVTETEYVANEEGVFKVEEESLIEQAAEAILGVEIEDELTQVLDADGNPVGEFDENSEPEDADDFSEVESDESIASQNSVEFNLGDESFETMENDLDSDDTLISDETFEPTIETIDPTLSSDFSFENLETDSTTFDSTIDNTNELEMSVEEENQELIEQEAHTDTANDAQQAANEFVEAGDYEAASEAREVAENEAWEAGDNSMLDGADSVDLEYAAEKQDAADELQQQQAINAQEGDYDAARENAQNAADAIGDADFAAGGDDHTGQADLEVENMDNAIWHEDIADENAQNAVDAAEDGNFYQAEIYADAATDEQVIADDFGDKGENGSILADTDPFSEVETGGGYEDNLADVDTGFDMNAGVDTGMDVADYDAGLDTSIDTGFDASLDTGMDTDFDSGTDDF